MNLNKIFIQTDNILNVNYLNFNVTFNMPSYFNINEVSNDLKMLCLILLYYPLDENLIEYKFTRKSLGDNIGLAFSGGVDSTAAYCLLPKDKVIPFYHKRIITPPAAFKNDNPLYVIDHFPSKVLILESNLEDVRKLTGSYPGFINVYSFYGGFVLLADYLKLGYLSNGTMLESTYLYKGYQFKDFHKESHYKEWYEFFKRANLPIFAPCVPCSEILTSKIVKDNNIFAQSCVRGTLGEGCNNCYKCFRKNLISGNLLSYNHEKGEISTVLKKRPLKQGASLVYAMNKLRVDIPELLEYKGRDLGLLENYFEYTLQAIPEEFRQYLKNELNKYSLCISDTQKLKLFKL